MIKTPKYYCGTDKRKFYTVRDRLAALQMSGFNCSIVKSQVVTRSDIKDSMLLARDKVLEIMGKSHSPNISATTVIVRRV